jgi:predicted GIY-YIG superfamily endonuclease
MVKEWIYILNLENNKKYVGKTINPNLRIEKHFYNNGSEWTKNFKPTSISTIFECDDGFSEDIVTIRCMKEYGIDNVRGGTFSQIDLKKHQKETIKDMFLTADNKCYKCGEFGHFISECKTIEVIVKPTQSGKTSVIIDAIKNKTNNNIMDIVFADNNILLANQTGQRINQFDKDAIVINCYNKNNKCSKDGLFRQFIKRSTIVFLSNKIRYDFLLSILNDNSYMEEINNNKNFKLRLWIDEFDSHLQQYINHILEFSKNNNVIKIYGLTATPSSIKDIISDNISFSFLKVDNEKYHFTKDHDFQEIKFKKNMDLLDMFDMILNDYDTNDGNIWFCPAERNVQSHDDVKKYFLSKKFICIVINGSEKKIHLNNNKFIDLADIKKKELWEILAEWIDDYRKKNKDNNIVITGNLCIERGITICSKNFMISHSIIVPQNNLTKLYQLAGRLNGNFKDKTMFGKKYVKPILFCDKNTKKQLLYLEEIAMGKHKHLF